MDYKKKWYWSIFLVISVNLTVSAQYTDAPASHQFEVFELPGNELGNHVQTIAQDSFGFMWFGSQNGLHRWDGYAFKTYLHDPEESESIASDYIESIHVGRDGTLWLGTWGEGLDRFDYKTQTFEHFKFDVNNPNTISNDYISDIVEDHVGNIWLATNMGLARLDPATGVFKHYMPDSLQANSLSDVRCRVLYVDKSDELWIGTGYPWELVNSGGLNRYRPETDDFEVFRHDEQDPQSIGDNKIGSLFEDSKGNFWVGTSNAQLYRMDRAAGTFLNTGQDSSVYGQFLPPVEDAAFDQITKFIFEDQEQRLWTGVWRGGIRYLEPNTGFSRTYFHDKNGAKSLPEPNPWQLFQSKDGTIWGSTAGMGARVFKLKKHLFNYFRLPSDQRITSFAETEDKEILIGTYEDGIKIFSPQDLRVNTLDFNVPLKPAQLEAFMKNEPERSFFLESWFNSVTKIVVDTDGWYWLRQPLKGVVRINPSNGDVQHYTHQAKNPRSIGKGWVSDIHKDRYGKIWIITSNGDLQLYHKESNDFQRFSFYKDKPLQTLMLESDDGSFYLAGNSLVAEDHFIILNSFDPRTGNFSNILMPERDGVYENPLNESVINILEGAEGNIWVSTHERIIAIDKTNKKVIRELNAFDYGAKRLQGMVIDKLGRFWLVGERLILFDHRGDSETWFKSDSNIKVHASEEIIFIDHQGYIYLGGQGGFIRFDPLTIGSPQNTSPPQSILTGLDLLNEEERNGFQFNPGIEKVTLSYKQNDFELRFAALDFNKTSTNRHQFKLEGYDEDWRNAGLEPAATYVKVPPGTYTFRVRGAGESGDWGPQQSLKIQITPPWWQTKLAYALFGLSFLALLYGIYRYQLNRSLEQAEALRLKELDVVKTKLYTNITHEFRTPLTVISGMATQIRENPEQWFNEGLHMIERNSHRLLELVNQMLDLNKLESGKLQLSLQQNDMVSFLQYIVDSIHSLAENRNIQVHFYAEEDEIWMDYDPDKIQQIITNLLTNAIKFSPEGGHIYVTAKMVESSIITTENAAKKQLQIVLRDTGTGIPENQLPFIFDRFYQVDDTATRKVDGSGIGLALVKELVGLMKGTIKVKSKERKGTTFSLLLPIEQKHALQAKVLLKDHSLAGLSQQGNEALVSIPKAASKDSVDLPQVLVIEDHSDVVAYIAACLQGAYRVLVAKDGAEGIEMALEHIPDLIITDVMMPYKNGFEVCQVLKNEERSSHIPIIMLTAKADIESKLEGFNQGADAYLAKPFDKKELLVRIKNLLEVRKKLQIYYRGLATPVVTENNQNTPSPLPNLEDAFVKKVNKIIEEYLDDFDFDVETLSKAVHLSHSQLHRKISALTGLSANRYIRHIRLHKAKLLLENPEISITAVAFDTGFSDPSYFGRVFKKAFRVTPKEYQTQQSLR
ncbi:MAG: two-component regulator propeller domain-containing protein [Saprospiraceae bacterium]